MNLLDRSTKTARRLALACLVMSPLPITAQSPGTNLGLPAMAAIGIHGGVARLERHSDGEEGGLFVDIGWLRGRSVRLQGEVSFLRASLTETLVVEDTTFEGPYYDLTAGATAVWLPGIDAVVSPYLLAGVAVHALSSAFGNSVLDQRYNANRFGSHVGAGIRLRLGSSRQSIHAEIRRVIADHVDRTVLRIGYAVLMGDLHQKVRR